MRLRLTLIDLFWLFGLFLVGGALTGNVVSQSCCFGNGCTLENRCTVAETQEPTPPETTLFGILIIIAAVTVTILELHYERDKRRKERDEREKNVSACLNKLNLLRTNARLLHVHLLADTALIAEISLLAQLLSCHLRLRRLAILSQVTVTTSLTPHTNTLLATCRERMSLISTLALRLDHLVKSVLVAHGTVSIHLLWNLHNVARTMKCL